jgi:hypothetical protein
MLKVGDKVAVIARNSADKKYAAANAKNTHTVLRNESKSCVCSLLVICTIISTCICQCASIRQGLGALSSVSVFYRTAFARQFGDERIRWHTHT